MNNYQVTCYEDIDINILITNSSLTIKFGSRINELIDTAYLTFITK